MAKEYHTKYKDWLTEYFQGNADTLIRAKDVYSDMTREGYHINLATVYRNLDRLTQEKVLAARKTADGEETFYQYMRPKMECTRHLHLLCNSCGKIIHLNCEFMEEIQEHLMEDHGFLVDCEASMLVGTCADCRSRLQSEGAPAKEP